MDVFRWFLLNITNDDIDFAFQKQIIKANDLLDTSMTGKMTIGTGDKMKRLISGFGNIPLLRRVQKIAHLMEDIREVYRQYPDSIKGLQDWQSKLWPIYDAAKKL